MLNIEKTPKNDTLTVALEGRLDTVTAPDLEKALSPIPEGVNTLVYDFSKLDYISSAGLRVLVATQKTMMGRGGSLTIKHPNDEVFEVFEMTGLSEVLDIEH